MMKLMACVLLVLILRSAAIGQRTKYLYSAGGSLLHRSSGPLVISSKDRSLQLSKVRTVHVSKEKPSNLSKDYKDKSVQPKEKQLTRRILDPLVQPTNAGVQIYEEKPGHRRLETYVNISPSDYAYPKPSENLQEELHSQDTNLQDDQPDTFGSQTIPEMICSLCARLSRFRRRLVCTKLFCYEWK